MLVFESCLTGRLLQSGHVLFVVENYFCLLVLQPCTRLVHNVQTFWWDSLSTIHRHYYCYSLGTNNCGSRGFVMDSVPRKWLLTLSNLVSGPTPKSFDCVKLIKQPKWRDHVQNMSRWCWARALTHKMQKWSMIEHGDQMEGWWLPAADTVILDYWQALCPPWDLMQVHQMRLWSKVLWIYVHTQKDYL